jgi:hypothetical protein
LILGLVVGPFEHSRGERADLRGDLADVRAGVAVLGNGFAFRRRQQRAGEPVDLGAVVVEVVLADDLRAAGLEQPGQGVAHSRPPDSPDVHGAGRVRRDELEVDLLAGERVVVPVLRPGGHDRAGELALGRRIERDVEEARAGDLRIRNARACGELSGDPGREVTRGYAHPLGYLKRDIRGIVAVLGITRALDGDGGRQRIRV